jgi:hypothetical protein
MCTCAAWKSSWKDMQRRGGEVLSWLSLELQEKAKTLTTEGTEDHRAIGRSGRRVV